MKENWTETTQWVSERWNLLWLEPSNGIALTFARRAVCLLAFGWLITFYLDSHWWYGAAGWNEAGFAKRLSLATDDVWPSRFRVTPLWMTSNPLVFKLCSGVGGLLSIAGFWGLGGRVTIALLAGLVLFLTQRSMWLTGAFEPFLIACLGYLIIDSGSGSLLRAHTPAPPTRWTATLATRLLQVHTWLLVLFGLGYLLSGQSWWRGEAVWWLAATDQAWLFDSEMLRGRILLVNACTPLVVLSACFTLAFYWQPRFRLPTLASGLLLAAAYLLLAGQAFYGMLLASMLLVSYLDPPGRAWPSK